MPISINGSGLITGVNTAAFITANSITDTLLANGSVTIPKVGLSGAVLQTLQWTYPTVYENTTSNSEYDLPSPLGDGTANITLSSTSNKVMFRAGMQCGQEDTWRQNFFRVYYSIAGGSWAVLTGFAGLVYISGTNGGLGTFTHEYLWAPSTISNIRFKIAQTGHASGGYLHLNQNNSTNSQSASNQFSVTSWITLTEIKG